MKTANRSRLAIALLVLVGFALSTGSCSRPSTLAPDSARSKHASSEYLSGRASKINAATTLEGDIGPGAHYVIYMPTTWNGDLVLYAHGYTAPIFPVGIPPGGEQDLVDALREIALQGGFAFAYSGYSQTGLGFKDAAQRTSQLASVFKSRVGQPRRTFLIGTSFGGLAAVKLVEAHPERFAGILTLCGMVGGVRAETDYISNVRVLFDHFYPNVLRGNLYALPADFDLQRDIVEAVSTAFQANPQPAFLMAQVDQAPIPFSSPLELVQSIIQALLLQAIELQDLLDRTHGQGFFNNARTVYTGDLPPDLLTDLNAHVGRYTDGPAAANFLDKYYDPTGDLRIPMVGLHTELDPVVPLFHEDIYRSLVESKGQGANLHQITLEGRYGHLQFTGEEIVSAFGQMIGLANRQPAP